MATMNRYRTPHKDASTEDIATHSAQADYDGEKYAGDPLALEEALVEAERFGRTRRGLKSRHIQLIALGGAIGKSDHVLEWIWVSNEALGTGLFVGSGMATSLMLAINVK